MIKRLVSSSASVLGAPPSKVPADSRLGEENKGHQLLMKMGKFIVATGAGRELLFPPSTMQVTV